MEVNHVQGGKKLRLSQPQQMMAAEREIVDEAYAGDIIGVFDPGIFSIGDTLCTAARKFQFDPIPTFAPEHFRRVRPLDTMKRKQFLKGMEQIAQEGAIQIFKTPYSGMEEVIVGVVGTLQFDVLEYRLKNEYGVDLYAEGLPYEYLRWLRHEGDEPLRAALAGLLSQYRGVRCTPEQVVVGAGADYLLSLLLQLLPEHRAVALEDPGYPAAYAAAALHGRQAVPIPVDGEGMCPDALADSGAGMAYVTPSHQFPLGVSMPAGRRSRLLHWAASAPDRWIIEDDYDSEFRWSSRPIPAMQGMDRAGRVVYLGTFSRSIAPAIRAAYLILPPGLLERYRHTFSHGACAVSRFEQESLRRFIAQGLYGRHLRRTGNLYRRKCALLTQALSAIPGAAISGGDAGLHFLLTLPRYSEEELTARAAEKSVRVYPLSRYCHTVPPKPSTVVLGFAGLSEDQLRRAAELLGEAWG